MRFQISALAISHPGQSRVPPLVLYIKMKLSFVRFCLYLIQIHISEPISTELCTRLPLCLEEVVGYVWNTIFDPFRHFHFLSGASAESWTQHGCRLKSHCDSVISVI